MAIPDWIVIGLFFVALVGIIVWVSRMKQNNAADYFLGGKDATWIAIGASIFASNIGSEHLIGLAGSGASSGMAMAHWEIQGWMILILGWVFVPFYSRSMVYTMPEFLEKRFNKSSRTILATISLISYVLTKVAVTVYAGGLVFQQVFGIDEIWGIDFFWIAAVGLVLITALYTVFGGMKSVLYTSVLQTPILLLGSLIILVLGLKELGGWDEMMRICDAVKVNEYGDSMTNLIRSNSDADFPWLGALIGSAVIGFWYWCTDQFIVQRVLSGKDERQSRRGTIFGAYLKLLPVFLFLIPGMIAYALHVKYIGQGGEGFLPVLANGNLNTDAAFPTLVAKLLPAGVKGLIVCGILAALMSSLASLFNSSAALFTIDFYQRYKPDTDCRTRHTLDSRNALCRRCALSLSAGRTVGTRPGHRRRIPYRHPVEARIRSRRHVGTALRSYHRPDTPRRQDLLQQRRIASRRKLQPVPLRLLRLQLAVLLRMDAGVLPRCRSDRIPMHQSSGTGENPRTCIRYFDTRTTCRNTCKLEWLGYLPHSCHPRHHCGFLYLFLVKPYFL